jgi:O-acetyl-ADP-ribose deacetylase (regulator of RNase III)
MNRYALTESCELVLQQADITTLALDGIVNAASERMLGGGGVDGAIHRASGPGLLEACRQVPEVRPGVRCPTGEARITPGFELPASYVIHCVGPVYESPANSAPLLMAAHRSSLRVAAEHGLRTLAFPAISCGVFGYPLQEAAAIALRACQTHAHALEQVHFALFGEAAWRAFDQAAAELLTS